MLQNVGKWSCPSSQGMSCDRDVGENLNAGGVGGNGVVVGALTV